MADDDVKLSSKTEKTFAELIALGGVKVPVLKKDVNFYQLPIEALQAVDVSDNQNIWYLDTVNGLDSNSGLSRSAPKKTGDAVVIACKTAGKTTGRLVVMAGSSGVVFTASNWSSDSFPFINVFCESNNTDIEWNGMTSSLLFDLQGGSHTFNQCALSNEKRINVQNTYFNSVSFTGYTLLIVAKDITTNCFYLGGDSLVFALRIIITSIVIEGRSSITADLLAGSGYIHSFHNSSIVLTINVNIFTFSGTFAFPNQSSLSAIKINIAKNDRDSTSRILYLGAQAGVTVNYQLIVDQINGITPVEIGNPAGTVAGKVIELLKYENKLDAEIIRATAAEALKADLIDGFVPSSQLHGYVDDVVDAYVVGSTPFASDWLSLTVGGTALTPESGKIYIVLTAGIYEMLEFRWSGTVYGEISKSIALGETSSTAYRGDRGKTAYDHSLLTSGNPHGVTKSDVGLENVDNVSDVNKPVSAAQQTALDLKANQTSISNIDNTSDVNKPVSTAQAAAIAAHADLLTGMHGLPALDYFVYGDTAYGGSIVDNLNTLARTMSFTCYGTSVGAPDTMHSWFGWHINSNVGTVSASQMVMAFGTDLIVKYRTKTASVWGPWRNGSTLVNNSTATAYTFLASDSNTCHIVNTSAATTRTVPSDSTAPDIAIGDSIEVQNIGTGVVTFVEASGVTIRSSLTLVMYGQYSVCMLRKIAANTWILTGERTAV